MDLIFLETNVFVEQVIMIPGHFALRVFHCICYFRHFLNRRRNLSQEVNWFWSHWFFCKTEMRDCEDCTKWWVFHSLKKLLILMTHMNWPQTTPRRSWLSTWGSGEFSCLLSQMNMQTAWWWRWVQLFTNEYADSLMVDWFLISNALLTGNVILGQNMVYQITQSKLLHFYDTTLCLNVIYYGKTWFIK